MTAIATVGEQVRSARGMVGEVLQATSKFEEALRQYEMLLLDPQQPRAKVCANNRVTLTPYSMFRLVAVTSRSMPDGARFINGRDHIP